MREMRRVGLLDSLDYVALLAIERSERFEPVAVRWLSVLLSECGWLSLIDVQLATACVSGLQSGEIGEVRGTRPGRLELVAYFSTSMLADRLAKAPSSVRPARDSG